MSILRIKKLEKLKTLLLFIRYIRFSQQSNKKFDKLAVNSPNPGLKIIVKLPLPTLPNPYEIQNQKRRRKDQAESWG